MAKWEHFLQTLSAKYLFHLKVRQANFNIFIVFTNVDNSSVLQRTKMRPKADPNLLVFSAER